ncbi:MAG: hypothetical protein CVU57_21020 [Deltaproteobacteria bacterium HGW-Deltaproteobacteria-15]|jgi:hypothetical protein|nr:MAG: hypothetical protein CVU57_21020 [Deltaproteobacteria bacterium HGW-Deltaproteobacteria-15]
MRIGNVIAALGIILCFLGLISLPLYNFHELPYLANPAWPKGSGWKLLAQAGIFLKPGILAIMIGGLLLIISKLLPRRYLKTEDDLLADEIKRGRKKKE